MPMAIDHRQNVIIFHCLTPIQKQIALAFLYWFKGIQAKKFKNCCPSQRTLAKFAKCCIKTIYNFLQSDIGKMLLKKENVKASHSKQQMHCIYHFIDKDFFKTLQWLEEMGFTQNWKKHHLKVMDMLDSRIAEFKEEASQFVYEKVRVLPTGMQSNYRDINTNQDTYLTTLDGICVDHFKTPEEARSYRMLMDTGISSRDAKILSNSYSYDALVSARQDYIFYSSCQPIRNIAAYMTSRCKTYKDPKLRYQKRKE